MFLPIYNETSMFHAYKAELIPVIPRADAYKVLINVRYVGNIYSV
jgi:hypothetical protein